MVTKEQIKNGLLRYLDAEVLPALPTSGKWVAGAAIILATSNFDRIYADLMTSPVIAALDISHDGLVDVDKLAGALKASAEKYGRMELSIPVIGRLYFSSDDVEKVKHAINSEANK